MGSRRIDQRLGVLGSSGPLLGRSDERDLDVDVAACRLGVRANAVRRIDQLSREVAVAGDLFLQEIRALKVL
jgi:hypothetical protein